MAKRAVQLVVISDVHLGTYGCQAEALLKYLRSIRPERMILNGDLLDIWQFSKSYFPKMHLNVIKEIIAMMESGVETYYITGNHDEAMRKFVDFHMGNLHIVNKALLELDEKKAWFFHGDVFDVTMQHSKWLAKLGANGYASLILLNRFVNFLLKLIGRKKISLSKRIKQGVKNAIKSKNNFEQTAGDIAIDKGYDYVVCGHIHKPEIKRISNHKGEVTYLNSGDWVENLTALEYNQKQWKIYNFNEDLLLAEMQLSEDEVKSYSNQSLFQEMLKEFALL